MNRKGNTPIILLIVLILIFLALASGGFYLFQKERVHNLELQDSMEEIKTKQRITEAKLKESEKQVADLQQKLKDAKTQIDTLSGTLNQEKQTRTETQAKLEQLSSDFELQKELRADLEKRLSQAQDDTRSVQAQLSELTSQKTELEAKVRELEVKTQNIELGKIVVAPPETAVPVSAKGKKQKSAPASKQQQQQQQQVKSTKEAATAVSGGQEGKVLVINKDYNFVVINLGTRDGVEVGTPFSIFRGNKYIGDIKVEKVHDAMSAAGFVTDGLKDIVNEGDKVVQKVK
jgi:hypothetical protein